MTRSINLLYPEWQGGRHPDVHRGACWLAEAVFARRGYVTIEAPAPGEGALAETPVQNGVFALADIAPRFVRTLDVLSRVQPERVLTLSGTCGGEAAPITWLNARHVGRVAVVWFDAHADLNTPATSPSGEFHGMVLRTLLGEGPAPFAAHIARPLRPEQVFLVGVRDLDPAEEDYLAEHPVRCYPELTPDVIDTLCADIAAAGCTHVYLHLDVDVFNPESFSDDPMPTPGGPDIASVTACLRALGAAFPLAGFGVCEYSGSSHAGRVRLHAVLDDAGLLPLI